MRRLPVFWLPLALVTLIASRGVIGLSTKLQLRQMISMILYEDELYYDVLLEKVKLDQKLAPFIKEKVPDIKNVDPLVALFTLTSTHPYYSGDDLNLSVTIVGTSIMCLMYKRVALHLALIIGLIKSEGGLEHFQIRSRVFLHTIPFYMDILSSFYKNFDNLLTVYETVFGMISLDSNKTVDYEVNSETLKNELDKLNGVIESSCVVNKMKEYCSSFNLSTLENCETVITDDQQISNTVDVNNYVEYLKENENALMNLFDEMDLFRHMDRDTWKVLLKIPDLPLDDPNQFKRTEMPTYRDKVEEIIDRRAFSTKYDIKLENENNGKKSEPPKGNTSAESSKTVTPTEDKPKESTDAETPE